MMDPSKLRAALQARMPQVIGDLRNLARDHAPDVPLREAGYSISNAAGDAGDVAVVRIYDEIWWLGVNAADFVVELDAVTAPDIRVEINSPGGDVFDGIAIYHALANHDARVTTRVDGIAASIASVIVQAGDRRLMQPASQMMVHDAWAFTVGNARDHEDTAELLVQQDEIIAGIYAARSGGDLDHFRSLMKSETFLTAEMAVEEELADEIIDLPAKVSDKNQRSLHAKIDERSSLHDEISEAMAVVTETVNSVDRVAALRADADKTLSHRIIEDLAGFRDAVTKLDALLTESDEPIPVDDINIEFLRWVSHHTKI